MNPDGRDPTAQERVAYLREPRRPVFRSDLPERTSQGNRAGQGVAMGGGQGSPARIGSGEQVPSARDRRDWVCRLGARPCRPRGDECRGSAAIAIQQLDPRSPSNPSS